MSDLPRSLEPFAQLADGVRPRTSHPWELFGQRLHRSEVHLRQDRVELVRGPVLLGGYSLRLFLPKEGKTAVGQVATSDLSDPDAGRLLSECERTSGYSLFPAPRVELPATRGSRTDHVGGGSFLEEPVVERLLDFTHALLSEFTDQRGVAPTFGSVRATLSENFLANSSGAEVRWPGQRVDLELAVKSSDGPEGPPPGEFWAEATWGDLPTGSIGRLVPRWCQLARDSRIASLPPTGQRSVLLPSSVSAELIPPVVEFQLSGLAELRQLGTPVGSTVGPPSLSFSDDPQIPGSDRSASFDDEGHPTGALPLVTGGKVVGHFYDALHAGALSALSARSGYRRDANLPLWYRFGSSPSPHLSNLSMPAGEDGSDEELIEGVDDGVWIDQIAFPNPDTISGTFGGEIRMGYRIEGGRIRGPVRGGVLGGLVMGSQGDPSLLGTVTSRGSASVLAGNLSAPTLRVESLSIAGGK
jgi:predicted Zn-dependent protease